MLSIEIVKKSNKFTADFQMEKPDPKELFLQGCNPLSYGRE